MGRRFEMIVYDFREFLFRIPGCGGMLSNLRLNYKPPGKFCWNPSQPYLCTPFEKREFSSVGSEHLPYKQRVGGSSPSTPTEAWH